uniref:Uncharacterized protein n=1 Tax=Ciona intestinalis TaxID=7719 RepID=H2XQ30_CIOIN
MVNYSLSGMSAIQMRLHQLFCHFFYLEEQFQTLY